MSDQPTPKLSIQDPVAPEVLEQFNRLQEARMTLAERILNLEQEKLRMLSAAHEVDQQKNRLFESVLMERGVAPNTPVSLDSSTGLLKVEGTPSENIEETPE